MITRYTEYYERVYFDQERLEWQMVIEWTIAPDEKIVVQLLMDKEYLTCPLGVPRVEALQFFRRESWHLFAKRMEERKAAA